MKRNNLATNHLAIADSKHIIEALAERHTEELEYLGYPSLTFSLIFNTFLQFNKRVKKLSSGYSYTFQDICGDDYWNQLTEKEKIHSYDCMMFLMEYANLPIICNGFLANHEFLYELE